MSTNNAASYPDPNQSKKYLQPYSQQPSYHQRQYYPPQPQPQQGTDSQQPYPQQRYFPQKMCSTTTGFMGPTNPSMAGPSAYPPDNMHLDPNQSKAYLPPYSQQPSYRQQPTYHQRQSYPPQPYPQQGTDSQQPYPQQTHFPQDICYPATGIMGPTNPSMASPSANPSDNMHPELYLDDSGNDEKGFGFSDKSIRRGFIRKVYSILMVQLAITGGMIAWFVYHKATQTFVKTHLEVVYVAIGLSFVLIILLVCCPSLRRKSPANIILLMLFTVVEGFTLGVLSSFFESEEVLLAAGVTAVVCLGLTLFAFQTKWDFTILGGSLFILLIILLIVGLFGVFFRSKLFSIIYASIGALLFSVYLIYDTQMLMGGNHKYSISPEEYIFAALTLYLDVIQIFIYILRIIGIARS